MSNRVFDTLTDTQQSDLREFAERMARQNRSLNMVAPSTIDDLWDRHILDSLQLVPEVQALIDEKGMLSALDIGTGGGLPAVPLAIAFSQNSKIYMQALDSDRKKVAAIRIMTLGLDAPLKLHDHRVEHHKLKHDLVVSRALASLSQLIEWSQFCLKPGGTMILLKGERYGQEIEDAKHQYNFDVESRASDTNRQAAVLSIRNIQTI